MKAAQWPMIEPANFQFCVRLPFNGETFVSLCSSFRLNGSNYDSETSHFTEVVMLTNVSIILEMLLSQCNGKKCSASCDDVITRFGQYESDQYFDFMK